MATNNRSNSILSMVVGAGLVVVGLLLGRHLWPTDPQNLEKPPSQLVSNPGDPPPPPPPQHVVATVGQDVEMSPLPIESAPPQVQNLDLVRQSLKPGTTHETLVKGTIESEGTDKYWGLESRVSIYYVFEAQIDREIIENDGSVVVENRHFRNIRSLKIDTTLKDLRIHLGPAAVPIIAGIGYFWPEAALAVSQFNGISLKPVTSILMALGIDPLEVTGAKQSVFKMFTQFDSLTGKSVKQVYYNKEDRTGVIRVTPLVGDMLDHEQFVHHNSAVLSDVLLFPERTVKPGHTWVVKGGAFTNLIDPGLRATTGGEIQMLRGPDRMVDGVNMAVVMASDGRLTLTSDDKAAKRIGWFEPKGELVFSPKIEAFVEGELSGKGMLEKVSQNHLLFKTEMKQDARIRVTYYCRVIDTAPSGGR